MLTEVENLDLLRRRRKAITTLLPYAVRQERGGQPEMFDAILDAARASGALRFMWSPITQFADTLISEASPRAIVLASPHIPWDQLTDRGDLVQQWAAKASTVPDSEEVAQNVVDMLLQIASEEKLAPHIPAGLWSWLTKRPSLPPICWGRYVGADGFVLKVVRGLEDVEVLKSYLLLVWSEWGIFWSDWDTLQAGRLPLRTEREALRPERDTPRSYGFDEMCASIREDFSGIEMSHHRAELIQRLNHVLGELDRGLEHLNQHNPQLDKSDLLTMKRGYRRFKGVLLEVEMRTSSPMIALLCALTVTPAEIRMVPCNASVRSSVLIVSNAELSV